MIRPTRSARKDRLFFTLLLCFFIGGLGCPGGEDDPDPGEPESGCSPDAVADVNDEQSDPVCSDNDSQTDVPPPAEAVANCTGQVGGDTVTSTATTSVKDSVISASCSMENGGACFVTNVCSFSETEVRDYTFTLDAVQLAEGQAPATPQSATANASVLCFRSAGGSNFFSLNPGDTVDVLVDPGDTCDYRLTVSANGPLGENGHVLATLSRDSVGGSCSDDNDCENPNYPLCQPFGSGTGSGAGTGSGVGTGAGTGTGSGGFVCGAGVFPDSCDDDTDCFEPNYECADGTCAPGIDNGDVCNANSDCTGDGLCDEFGTCRTGRAVLLDNATGTLPAQTRLCLSEVGGLGCTGVGTECLDQNSSPALHLHREINIIGQATSFPDPNGDACGHGIVVGNPECGPDSVPSCF